MNNVTGNPSLPTRHRAQEETLLDSLRKIILSALWHSGLAGLARPFTSGLGAILMLHRVTELPGGALGVNRHLAITPAFLDAVLTEMKAMGFHFVTMDALVERLKTPAGDGAPLAVLSLDDGYRDNRIEALPVLEKHNVPAILHVAPALIDRTVLPWWEVLEAVVAVADHIRIDGRGGPRTLDCSTPGRKWRACFAAARYLTGFVSEAEQADVLARWCARFGVDALAVTDDLLMDWNEIRLMAQHPLIEIGAHTTRHYSLKRLDADMALMEIAGAVDQLAAQLGKRPRHMAYPYGHAAAAGAREAGLASQAGLATAVTTRHGLIQPGHARHLHALPRIALSGRFQEMHYVRPMLTGATTVLVGRGRRLVTT